jgi:hypothetical protein
MNDISIRLSRESAIWLRKLVKRHGVKAVFDDIFKLFDKLASGMAGHITQNELAGQNLKIRTGSLARSIVGRATFRGGVPAMQVGVFRGPSLRYAGIQEYGTRGENPSSPYDTIRPKNAKALAMPVGPSLTPAGVARYKGPRQDPNDLTYIPFNTTGNVVGALYHTKQLQRLRKRKSGFTLKDAKAAYLLLKQVDIKPHWYLRTGVRNYLPIVARELKGYLGNALFGNR